MVSNSGYNRISLWWPQVLVYSCQDSLLCFPSTSWNPAKWNLYIQMTLPSNQPFHYCPLMGLTVCYHPIKESGNHHTPNPNPKDFLDLFTPTHPRVLNAKGFTPQTRPPVYRLGDSKVDPQWPAFVAYLLLALCVYSLLSVAVCMPGEDEVENFYYPPT